MKIADKSNFIKKSIDTLEKLYDMMENLPKLRLQELPADETALIIIDMINGFAREGALKSTRVEALIPAIATLSEECGRLGIPSLAFADSHCSASPEFGAYPPHCLAGTPESEMVSELYEIGGYQLMPKNSTNGFIEKDFQKWLKENSHIRNFIITGDCTDICIQQFAVSLKTWFNMRNESSHILLPVNAVDTYDLGLHDADLLNVVTLFSMAGNGVELFSSVEVK